MILPVVGQALVELAVLLLRDIVRIPRPDRFRLVQLLVLRVLFLDGLLLLLFLVFRLVLIFILADVLDLGLLVLSLALLRGLLLLVLAEFLVTFLLYEELDGVADELRVLLNNLLDLRLLEVLCLILLDVQDDLGAATDRLAIVGTYGERTASGGLPQVLLIIVVLRDDDDSVGHEVRRVETYTELSNHGDISTRLESLHECLGARLGNGTKVIYEISLGHANATVKIQK
ncbi:hypothetical protein X777_11533 [Ooceraea biroi]|uniref:Uncharacterized protein n=1 Tax=Ooceraea biroi TaxID=2015173 RepID=A0A026W1Z3_OOCBI|nr:hypothetical protein X777_11533 [Ooceraea biroi]